MRSGNAKLGTKLITGRCDVKASHNAAVRRSIAVIEIREPNEDKVFQVV